MFSLIFALLVKSGLLLLFSLHFPHCLVLWYHACSLFATIFHLLCGSSCLIGGERHNMTRERELYWQVLVGMLKKSYEKM